MKKLNIIFLTIFFIVALTGGLVFSALYLPVVKAPMGFVYNLKAGTGKKTLVSELHQQGLIKFPAIFSIYVYIHKNDQLKTGEYKLPQGATPVSIWRQITTGKGQIYYTFTIIPGWNFKQVREVLDRAPTLRHLTTQYENKQIMSLLGSSQEPEGQFYPETYYYTRSTPDVVILKRAYNMMQSKLKEAWAGRDTTLPYQNVYEALIVASLVEKEAYLDSERPMIAGVIINRLQRSMLLQIDPTVIYGLGARYDGTIHKADLLEDTPYNTYVHKGLPPTPIAMPGPASIQAVMHAAKHDYLYFVAKGDKKSHEFTTNLTDHHRAVDAAAARKQTSSLHYFNETKVRQYMTIILAKEAVTT